MSEQNNRRQSNIHLDNRAAHDYFGRISDLRPREVAIIGVSLLESGLRYLILSKLIDGSEKLFEGVGIPNSLAARAKLARAMGLISKELLTETITLGRIRNEFAHRYEVESFEDVVITKISNELKLFTIEDATKQCQLIYNNSFEMKKAFGEKNIYAIADTAGFALVFVDFGDHNEIISTQSKFLNSIKTTWAVIMLSTTRELQHPSRI